jgi:hypothetical protein
LCPTFDFIKNRFKPKSKLKPEPSDHPEGYAQGNISTDVDTDSNTNAFDQGELMEEGSNTSDPQRLSEWSEKGISIEDATNHLHGIERQKTDELVQQISPIRNSAQASLQSIVDLAADLQNEEIKVEDQRFESAVENARSMVITSILKDANSSFPEIASYGDAIKFKDRLESLTNRFGQLTGSHSKLFNVFLKKYADKFRSEFADFSNLNKKATKLIKNYDLDLEDAKTCTQRITDLANSVASMKDSKERIAATLAEVEVMEEDVAKLMRSRQEIEQSEEYKTYALLESEARELEKNKAEFRDYVSELFSHLNRAFTKYSYGVSKSVAGKIDVLSSSPWEIFLNQREIDLNSYSESSNGNMERSREDHERIEAYRTLLVEIRGAVIKGTISLKDSDKVSTYLDRAIDMFPKTESRGWEIQKKAISIKQNQNRKAFNSIKSLDEQIRRNKSDIAEKKFLIEEAQNSIEEKGKEINHLTDECNNLLTEIIGQEKIITTTY